MSPTGDLLVTFIFLLGRCPVELAQGPSRVALASHFARGSTPFWVTMQSLTEVGSKAELAWTDGNIVLDTCTTTSSAHLDQELSTVLAQDHFYSDF